jgi:hypothetical protein
MTKEKRSRSRTRSNSGGAKSESQRRGRSNAVASHGRSRSGAVVSPVELIAQQIKQKVAHTNTAEGLVQAAEIILEHERPKTTKLTPEETYKLLNEIWEAAKENLSIENANKIRTNEAIQRCLTYKLQLSTGQDFLKLVREYYMEKGFIALTVIKSEFGRTGSRSNELELIAKDEELSPLREFLNNFSNDVNTIYNTVIKSIKTNLFDNSISINEYLARLNNSFVRQNEPSLDEELILDIVQAVIFSSSKENLPSEIKTVTRKHAPNEIVTTADRRNDLDSFIEQAIVNINNPNNEKDLNDYFELRQNNQKRLGEIQKELKRALTIQRHVKAIIAKIDANDKNIGETLHEIAQQDSNDRAILKALCGYNEVEGLTNEEITKISQMAEDSNTRLSKSSYRQSVGTFTSIWDYIRSILDKIFNNKHKTAFSWEVEKRLAEGNESSEEKSSEEDKRAEEAMDTKANREEVPKEEGAALRETELRKQAEEAEAKAIKELQDMALKLSEVSTKEELNPPSTEDINREKLHKVSYLIDEYNTSIKDQEKVASEFEKWKEGRNKGTKKE